MNRGSITRLENFSAAAAGALFATIIVLFQGRGHLDRAVFGDGILFRYVAQHLASSLGQVSGFLGAHGPALRYGRIGLPALIWLLSAGKPAAMPLVQPAIMISSAAAIASASRILLPRARLAGSLVPFIAPGLTASLAGGFAEPLAIALCLWGTIALRARRNMLSALTFAGAMLVRENAFAVVVGILAWRFAHRERRDAVMILIASLIPVVAWHMDVAARFGHLPLLDPWLARSRTVGFPLVAFVTSFGRIPGPQVAMMAIQVCVVIAALSWWRLSPMSAAAAACALLVLSTGAGTWRYIGDGARVAAFMDVYAVVALVAAVTDRHTQRAGVGP